MAIRRNMNIFSRAGFFHVTARRLLRHGIVAADERVMLSIRHSVDCMSGRTGQRSEK